MTTPIVPGLETPRTYVIKNSPRRDFMTTLLKENSEKLGPSHYQRNDTDFKVNPK